MPISKISLGALEDLGYTVSYGVADIFKPTKFVVKYINSTANLKIGFYNDDISTTILEDGYNTISGRSIKLRKGIQYSFIISSTVNIKLAIDTGGATLVTTGVTNNNISTGTITYTPPSSVSTLTSYWLVATGGTTALTRVIIL